eukprot:Opistho-2@23109
MARQAAERKMMVEQHAREKADLIERQRIRHLNAINRTTMMATTMTAAMYSIHAAGASTNGNAGASQHQSAVASASGDTPQNGSGSSDDPNNRKQNIEMAMQQISQLEMRALEELDSTLGLKVRSAVTGSTPTAAASARGSVEGASVTQAVPPQQSMTKHSSHPAIPSLAVGQGGPVSAGTATAVPPQSVPAAVAAGGSASRPQSGVHAPNAHHSTVPPSQQPSPQMPLASPSSATQPQQISSSIQAATHALLLPRLPPPSPRRCPFHHKLARLSPLDTVPCKWCPPPTQSLRLLRLPQAMLPFPRTRLSLPDSLLLRLPRPPQLVMLLHLRRKWAT